MVDEQICQQEVDTKIEKDECGVETTDGYLPEQMTCLDHQIGA